ncbi:MAG: HXXEE domain-containing protein [Pseudomonadota bacterium]
MSIICLLIFAIMAWMPFGQQAFLEQHWMKIGAYIAPVLLFMAFHARSDRSSPLLLDISLMASVLTVSYLVHQVEEHWVDILGREYPLYEFLNTLIADVAGEERYGVLTPSALFYVNAGMVWTVGFTAILVSPRHSFPAIAIAGLMLVNGVAHLLNAIAYQSYNSGLLTGTIIFIPISLLFYRALTKSGMASATMLTAGIIWGFLGHVLLFAGLFAANVYKLFPPEFYYAGLIVWGAVPLLLFRPRSNQALNLS